MFLSYINGILYGIAHKEQHLIIKSIIYLLYRTAIAVLTRAYWLLLPGLIILYT